MLDPDGFAFNTLGFNDRDLAIGFDGTNYLAVWTDNPNQDAQIYGTRIAQDGTILDPNRIHVSTDPPLPPPPPPPPPPPAPRRFAAASRGSSSSRRGAAFRV